MSIIEGFEEVLRTLLCFTVVGIEYATGKVSVWEFDRVNLRHVMGTVEVFFFL